MLPMGKFCLELQGVCCSHGFLYGSLSWKSKDYIERWCIFCVSRRFESAAGEQI